MNKHLDLHNYTKKLLCKNTLQKYIQILLYMYIGLLPILHW